MPGDLLQSGQPGLRLHGRDGAGPGARLVRRVRARDPGLSTRARRAHLMSAERIRELNDRFRTTMTGGRMLMTAGVNALPADIKAAVIQRVTTFSDFTATTDPHREHDFGTFSLAGRKFFSK